MSAVSSTVNGISTTRVQISEPFNISTDIEFISRIMPGYEGVFLSYPQKNIYIIQTTDFNEHVMLRMDEKVVQDIIQSPPTNVSIYNRVICADAFIKYSCSITGDLLNVALTGVFLI